MLAFPSRETLVSEMCETEDLEESDRADIGGECGGKGTEAGSTLGNGGIFFGGVSRMGAETWWLRTGDCTGRGTP